MAMRLIFSNSLALIALLAAAAFPVAAQDLDAALDAQKKKVTRRVYSEKALLDKQNLEVPRAETEEDRALEKKLKELEAKQDAEPRLQPTLANNLPSPVRLPSAEEQNWLTAAVLDELQSAAATNEADDQWLAQELDRRKELKAKESQAREDALVEKLLKEKTAPPDNSMVPSPLQKYQPAAPALFGSKESGASSPQYIIAPSPLAGMGRSSKQDPPVAPRAFSPAAARLKSALDKDPLRSTRPDSFYTTPGGTSRKSSSVFSYNRDEPEPAPLSPIEMIKQSSPINRPNPFADDYVPEFKHSIWQ